MTRRLLLLFGLLLGGTAWAQVTPESMVQCVSSRLDSTGLRPYVTWMHDTTLTRPPFDTLKVDPPAYSPLCYAGRGLVYFRIDHDKKKLNIDGTFLRVADLHYECTATLDIQAVDDTGGVFYYYNQQLKIRYDNREGVTHPDKAYFVTPEGVNVREMRVFLKWLTTDQGGGTDTLPNNVELYTEIKYTAFKLFSDPPDAPAVDLFYTAALGGPYDYPIVSDETGNLVVGWGEVDGAVEYQLEWLFVPKETHLRRNEFMFRNHATRVTTTAQFYQIPLHYEGGYVVYRVRALGRCSDCAAPLVREGDWSAPDTVLSLDTYFDAFLAPPDYDTVATHEPLLNWRYTLDLAEEGKNKVTLAYFDGDHRNRQLVTRNNTDSTVLVAETVYDAMGRSMAEFLPAPAFDVTFGTDGSTTGSIEKMVQYYQGFNQNMDGAPFTRNDLQDTGSVCAPLLPMAGDSSGAGWYYAYRADPSRGYQSYVPNAESYPFSVTSYLNDPTGRPRTKGGVGKAHQIGAGHETRYLYARPDQDELNRLFGTDVGLAKHYMKNTVVDPNGGVTVTYQDMKGHTIATMLAGEAPGSMQALPSTPQTFTVDLGREMATIADLDQGAVHAQTQFSVSEAGTHEFSYAVSTKTMQDLCAVCPECVYSLELSLQNECGEELFPDSVLKRTLGTPSPDWLCPEPFSFDSALNITAASRYAAYASDGVLWPNTLTFSFEFWIYFDQFDAGAVVLQKQNAISDRGYKVSIADSGRLDFLQKDAMNKTVGVRTKYVPFETDTWSHVVINRNSRNPDNYSIYIDGALYAKDTGLPTARQLYVYTTDDSLGNGNVFNNDSLTIGKSGSSFLGRMDDLRLYHRLLTADEAIDHYRDGCGGGALDESNLVLNVKFDTLIGGYVPNEVGAYSGLKGYPRSYGASNPLTLHERPAGCDSAELADHTEAYFAFDFETALPIGSYTVSRTLRLDQATLERYVAEYPDRDTCLRTEADFIQEALDSLDYSQCYNCAKCYELCGACDTLQTELPGDTAAAAYNKNLPYVRNHMRYWTARRLAEQIVADTTSPEYLADYAEELRFVKYKYADILKVCQGQDSAYCVHCDDTTTACPVDEPCEAYKRMMLADLSPGGQYAFYWGTSKEEQDAHEVTIDSVSVDVSDAYYSLLRTDNELGYYIRWDEYCGNDTLPRDYQHPAFLYEDEYGVPDTVSFYDVTVDSVVHKTPDELTPEQFVRYWRPSWAYALLELHPEICEYRACLQNPPSAVYSEAMLAVDGYYEAKAKGFLNPFKISETVWVDSALVPTAWVGVVGGSATDSLCADTSTCACDTLDPHWARDIFIDRLLNFTQYPSKEGHPPAQDYSIWEVAAAVAYCGYLAPAEIDQRQISELTGSPEFVTCVANRTLPSIEYDPADTVMLDRYWQTFRGLYLSLKYQYQTLYCQCNNCNGFGGGSGGDGDGDPPGGGGSGGGGRDTCIFCGPGRWCKANTASLPNEWCDRSATDIQNEGNCACPPCQPSSGCANVFAKCDPCAVCRPCEKKAKIRLKKPRTRRVFPRANDADNEGGGGECPTCPPDTSGDPPHPPADQIRTECVKECEARARVVMNQLRGCLEGLPNDSLRALARKKMIEGLTAVCAACCEDNDPLYPKLVGGMPKTKADSLLKLYVGPTVQDSTDCHCNVVCVAELVECDHPQIRGERPDAGPPDTTTCRELDSLYAAFVALHSLSPQDWDSLTTEARASFIEFARGKLDTLFHVKKHPNDLLNDWEKCVGHYEQGDGGPVSGCCNPPPPPPPHGTDTHHKHKLQGRPGKPCDTTVVITPTQGWQGGVLTQKEAGNLQNLLGSETLGGGTNPLVRVGLDTASRNHNQPATVRKNPCGVTVTLTNPAREPRVVTLTSGVDPTPFALLDNGSNALALTLDGSRRTFSATQIKDDGQAGWSYQYTRFASADDHEAGGALLPSLKASAITIPGGGLMVAGTTFEATSRFQPALFKLQADGVVEWAQRYNYNAYSGFLNYAAVTPARYGYLTVGTAFGKPTVASAVQSQMALSYLGEQGTTLWSRTFKTASADTFLKGCYALETRDHHILAVGALAHKDSATYSHLTFVLTDVDGVIQKQLTIGLRDSAEGRLLRIPPRSMDYVPAFGGGVLVAGTLTDTLVSDTVAKGFVLQVDDTLGVRFARYLDLPGYDNQIHSIARQAYGKGYVATGVYYNDTTPVPNLLDAYFDDTCGMDSLAVPLYVDTAEHREVEPSPEFQFSGQIHMQSVRSESGYETDADDDVMMTMMLFQSSSAEAEANVDVGRLFAGSEFPASMRAPCADCPKVRALVEAFDTLMALRLDSTTAYVRGLTDYERMRHNWLNDTLGYNLGSYDYYLFLARCDSVSDTLRLCDEPAATPVQENNCYRRLYDETVAQAKLAYERYVEEERRKFRQCYIVRCMQVGTRVRDTFTRRHHQREYQTTLYYYAQDGSLYRTVPPHAFRPLDSTAWDSVDARRARFHASVHDSLKTKKPAHDTTLASDYAYNSLGQLVRSHSPDADSMFYWYDRLGRTVLTQNRVQRDSGAFEYVFYDPLNRPYESGLITHAALDSARLLEFHDAEADTHHLVADSVEVWVREHTRYEVVRTYLDNDRFAIGLPVAFASRNLRRRTASAVYHAGALDTTDYHDYSYAQHFSYDLHGNVDTLLVDEPKMRRPGRPDLGFKRIAYHYDLISGKTNRVWYQKDSIDQYYHHYTYDADNRLTHAFSSRDGLYWQQDAKYFYYLHGPLARVEVGQNQVQGVDYAYTLQGWVKGVNSDVLKPEFDMGRDGLDTSDYVAADPTIHANVARDVFGYTLGYFYEASGTDLGTFRDYRPVKDGSRWSFPFPQYYFETSPDGSNYIAYSPHLYNGNIARMATAVDFRKKYITADTTQGKAFHYDQLNRLVGMDVYNNTSELGGYATWGADVGLFPLSFSSGVINPVSVNRAYQTAYAYDGAGNILKMYRNANDAVGSYRMDVLDYHYKPNTNQLTHIDDTVNISRYSVDLDDQDTLNYTYDGNGSMTSDTAAGVLSIKWNRFKRPVEKILVSGDTIRYGYDAAGYRVYKKTGDKETFYVRDGKGNILSIYEAEKDTSIVQTENHLYGSSRLGIDKEECILVDTLGVVASIDTSLVRRDSLGLRRYEFSGHTGNVLAVTSDRKIAWDSLSLDHIDYFFADIYSVQDYDPYGMIQSGRNWSREDSRFGYQSSEKNSELGDNHYTTYYRELDVKGVHWESVDPKAIAGESPYVAMNNNPIILNDKEGDCPICPFIIMAARGAAVGAGAELTAQVLVNVYNGQNLTTALSNVDINDVGAAAMQGAATFGLSNASQLSRVGKVLVPLAFNALSELEKARYDVNPFKTEGDMVTVNSPEKTVAVAATNLVVGEVLGKVASQATSNLVETGNKVVDNLLDKATKTTDNGETAKYFKQAVEARSTFTKQTKYTEAGTQFYSGFVTNVTGNEVGVQHDKFNLKGTVPERRKIEKPMVSDR